MEADNLLVELAFAYMQTKSALYKKAADEIIRLRKIADPKKMDDVIPMMVDIKTIMGVTCKYYAISMEDFLSKRRNRLYVCARQDATMLARSMTSYSTPAIGQRFNLDHTSVVYYEKRGKRMLKTVPNYDKVLEVLKQKVLDEEIIKRKERTNGTVL